MSDTRHAGNPDEIYCELVKGLGEALVSGTVPGSALSFRAPKTDPRSPEILTFPSKSHGMFVPESLIFRSDSNGEDLAGYAGAGLYESITVDSATLEIVDFSGDQLMTDAPFRTELLGKICEARPGSCPPALSAVLCAQADICAPHSGLALRIATTVPRGSSSGSGTLLHCCRSPPCAAATRCGQLSSAAWP